MNVKGGYTKRLLVQQNHDNRANCMLKTEFLKHADHYTMRLERMLLAEDIPIFPAQPQFLLAVREFGEFRGAAPRLKPAEYEFTGTFSTVLGFVHGLNEWLLDFGIKYTAVGIQDARGIVPVVDPDELLDTADLPQEHELVRDGHIMRFDVQPGGECGFTMTPEACSRFETRLPLLRSSRYLQEV